MPTFGCTCITHDMPLLTSSRRSSFAVAGSSFSPRVVAFAASARYARRRAGESATIDAAKLPLETCHPPNSSRAHSRNATTSCRKVFGVHRNMRTRACAFPLFDRLAVDRTPRSFSTALLLSLTTTLADRKPLRHLRPTITHPLVFAHYWFHARSHSSPVALSRKEEADCIETYLTGQSRATHTTAPNVKRAWP